MYEHRHVHMFIRTYVCVHRFAFLSTYLCLGGLGSCAAPNDGGIHQNFHLVRQGYQRCALGWLRNIAASQISGESVNNAGDPKFTMALSVSLESDAYALQTIRDFQSGKLVMWSWSSRGYVDEETLSEWHGRDISQLMAFKDKGALTEFVKINSLPPLKILGEDSSNHDPSLVTDCAHLSGEKLHIWFVDLLSDGMIPLPHWMSLPIECAMAVWKQEHSTWEDRIKKRSPKPLPPSQQKMYECWLEKSLRRLVLDQSTKSQIKNPSSCSKAHLTKHCILLDTQIGLCTYVCTYVHKYVCMMLLVHTYINTYLHAYIHTCMCAHTCTITRKLKL